MRVFHILFVYKYFGRFRHLNTSSQSYFIVYWALFINFIPFIDSHGASIRYRHRLLIHNPEPCSSADCSDNIRSVRLLTHCCSRHRLWLRPWLQPGDLLTGTGLWQYQKCVLANTILAFKVGAVLLKSHVNTLASTGINGDCCPNLFIQPLFAQLFRLCNFFQQHTATSNHMKNFAVLIGALFVSLAVSSAVNLGLYKPGDIITRDVAIIGGGASGKSDFFCYFY